MNDKKRLGGGNSLTKLYSLKIIWGLWRQLGPVKNQIETDSESYL